MRHQDLVINHVLESWTYADATARTTATGFVSGDVGRIAYQSDTGAYWRLLSTAPTWAPITLGVATLQAASDNPAATASTTNVMMGLGDDGAVMTPIATGKILIVVTGSILNDTGDKDSVVTLYHGTGTPPVNGAAATGTSTTVKASKVGVLAAAATIPFSLTAFVAGLTVGTVIWIDVALKTEAGGNAQIIDTTVTAVELP